MFHIFWEVQVNADTVSQVTWIEIPKESFLPETFSK
jgi:hypothetical protein